jgi:hypothetical protein
MNKTKSLVHFSTIATLLLIGGCSNPSGTYEGSCLNSTYGKRASMLLVINENGGQLSGTLTISGDLVGGGDIKGRIDNFTVSFTTKNPEWGQITWTGEFSNGKTIAGRYFVETPINVQREQGITSQQGTWNVEKK